ncbi:MAG: F0F1 ATP synthase subunit A [Oscillospiraceae bacterium]|nr:F0F1 ATP synthase subunit A [Oscillospiraceae bacterium]
MHGSTEVNVTGPKISFEVFGIKVTETVVISWIVMAIIIGLILFLTHNMSLKKPGKRQIIAEWIVTTFNNLVKDSMGKRNVHYAPYMTTIFMFSIFGSLISLIGLRPVTGDYNTTLAWALITFIMIQVCKIKNDGFIGYLKGFTQPIKLLTPLNIISEIATPVSMSFRHFGNIASGIVITQLLYYALTAASNAIGLSFPVFAVAVPSVLSVYFDLFTGFMQAFIFTMLSMAYIGATYPEEENS